MTKSFVKHGIFSKIATILFAILCFALCISCAELFSSLITVGGFSNLTSGEVKQSAYDLYAIKIYSTTTKIQAQEMAQLSMHKNSAGYVMQTAENFIVLASCYENQQDAVKVKENLEENNTACEIMTLNFPEIKFNVQTVDQEKTTLINAIQSYKKVYKKLYDLSVSIDTNLYTEIQAKVLLNDIISEFEKIKTSFESIFNSKLTNQLLQLKLSLTNVSDILDQLKEFSSNEIPYSAQVKNTYFQILQEYLNLSKSI